jgi:oligopeptide transport system substrate-binding protein
MIVLQHEEKLFQDLPDDACHLDLHPSFRPVYKKLKKWLERFPAVVDDTIFNDLFLLYLAGTKEYLDHRNPSHLFRLVLSIHLMRKRLLRMVTFSPDIRRIEVRWFPTSLSFPFFSKSAWGCLIGCNVMGRYELFDEENIKLTLEKHIPEIRLVKESSYCHMDQYKNLKIFYLEIEKKDGSALSFKEHRSLRSRLEKGIKNSIHILSPPLASTGLNQEEIYKNIFVLNQEIQSVQDIPQAYITLDQQTGEKIVFRVTLVYVSPFHQFSLKDRFFDCGFFSESAAVVKRLGNHPVEAHIFRLHLSRTTDLLRSDGSLDFYAARKKVVSLLMTAIGEFRDYTGGILIKQQELFQQFKDNFSEMGSTQAELMDVFFYGLMPLEKQALLHKGILSSLFTHFLQNRHEKLTPDLSYIFKICQNEKETFVCVYGEDPAIKEIISSVLQDKFFRLQDIVYNIIELEEKIFFNCVLLSPQATEVESFIQALQESLHKWHQKMKDQQILRIGLEYSVASLDPRIAGGAHSGDVLRLLFEGLTRFDEDGSVENALAESIMISPNLKEYTFKIRYSQWNDGSPISAYDFEYAWKKILSPDFKTSFAYLFYSIHNAKEAKDGKVPLDQVGLQVIDDHTLKVTLVQPDPHFLQLTAHSAYSPIHRFIDQEHPQWPYQCQKHYPCNGPFQLKINQPNQGYHLIRNPFYWDPHHASWDQVIMTYMTPMQAIQAFQKKEVDWIGNPFGSWHSAYVAGKDGCTLSFPNSMVSWCIFNTRDPLFSHRKLRQAFAFAINRAQIIAGSFLSLTPAYSPLLSLQAEGRPSLFPEYDAEKARSLFHEALEELGISVDNFPPITLMFHQKGIREYSAFCLKQQFKECLGIECHLKPLPWGEFFEKTSDGSFQLAFVHWNSWVADPSYILNIFKVSEEKINFSKWEHPAFQNLLDLSAREVNPFQRSSCLLQAEEILSQEMPIIPLFYQPAQALVRKELTTFYRSPCGPFNLARSFNKKKEI